MHLLETVNYPLAFRITRNMVTILTIDIKHYCLLTLNSLCSTNMVCLPFLSVRLLSVLRGHSGFSFPPQRPINSDFEGFIYQILSITLFSYLDSWERASIFRFECSVLNKGTTGTIFITSLVWRGPWLGIEPGTSRTRSQHYTTRLSRRRSLTGDWTRDLPHLKQALYQ